MKLSDLSPSHEHILEWFKENAQFPLDKAVVKKSGKFWLNGTGELTLKTNVEEIKYPIGKVNKLSTFAGALGVAGVSREGKLNSLKNMPESSMFVHLSNQSITKIDHPIRASIDVILTHNLITSLKDIHRFVSCPSIDLCFNPVKSAILGLLLIPEINVIRTHDFFLNKHIPEKTEEIKTFHRALSIVAKYVGKGRTGLIDAQEELIDNDLDDFAEV